jgi:hypothetical protein
MKSQFFSRPSGMIIGLILLLFSCKEFIEPSIDKRLVTLQAPSDAYSSPKYNVSFWWDEVEDALVYRLQIVSNSFSSPGSLIADTLVNRNTFSLNLDPGAYQWRVRAENGSSATTYSAARTLTVLQSSIKQQSVELGLPVNNALTNKSQTSFRWSSLYGATQYRIQIDTNSFASENALVYDQTVPGQQVNFSLPKDMIYQWRVRQRMIPRRQDGRPLTRLRWIKHHRTKSRSILPLTIKLSTIP